MGRANYRGGLLTPETAMHPFCREQQIALGLESPPPPDAQWRARVAYYGLCAFMDRQVGRVLDALEAAGLARNTLVIYTSDHGEILGEHGLWWKGTFFDGTSRVPMIVSWPGRTPVGTTVESNVSLIDAGPPATQVQPQRMVRQGPWKRNYYHQRGCELFNLSQSAAWAIWATSRVSSATGSARPTRLSRTTSGSTTRPKMCETRSRHRTPDRPARSRPNRSTVTLSCIPARWAHILLADDGLVACRGGPIRYAGL